MADDKKSTYQLELERRANDLIRVFNPQDKDYIIEWDRKSGTKLFRVPAKGEAVFVRYIAEKYIREMFDKIIEEKASKAVIEENQKRVSKGMETMTPWKEQFKFESKFYHPTDMEVKQLLSLLYVGIESEFGIDRAVSQVEAVDESKSPFERGLEEVAKEKANQPKVSNGEPTPLPMPAQTANKQFKCEICGFETDTHISLLGHNRKHRNENIEVIKQQAVEGVAK